MAMAEPQCFAAFDVFISSCQNEEDQEELLAYDHRKLLSTTSRPHGQLQDSMAMSKLKFKSLKITRG
eukprot:CAMPEP_0182884032 /NCGR_PEP_ID=MMETSP0034_2-20130328/18741_1 /TAXON_ID=156128 /ORGANISM="Nephroselmis pyriformis, Strain CCMP717" /LENGTH=66 /DNA_ID=CAMNT_0025017197 /DNA_START=35 /DNA_END=232 /DNA_ORIENTATION=+